MIQQPKNIAPEPKRLRASIFAGAIVLFFVLNGFAYYLFTNYKNGIHDDFAATALQKSPNKPDVVFAGSSTVLYPLILLDASINGMHSTLERYTRVRFAEDALKKDLGRDVQVNNIAFLGFMLSDDLFVVKNYLTGEHAPSTLVLMVAPRDFCDSLFASPASGIAFRKLSDWSHMSEFLGTYLTQPNDYIDFALGKGVFTFAVRAKIQDKLHDLTTDRLQILQSKFGVRTEPINRWERSVREYSTRYRDISFEKMHNQFVFLDRLLMVCQSRGINVVLINAPLTHQSLGMLPPGVYDSYCAKLKSTAESRSCQYFDFSNSKQYSDEDFWDIVHLNDLGARKLIAQIMPTISKSINRQMASTNHLH